MLCIYHLYSTRSTTNELDIVTVHGSLLECYMQLPHSAVDNSTMGMLHLVSVDASASPGTHTDLTHLRCVSDHSMCLDVQLHHLTLAVGSSSIL